MEYLKFGEAKLPSVINDPFKKTLVKKITVSYQDFWGDGRWKATGYVYFQNGATSGDQKFEAATFDEVVLQMKAAIDNL